MTNHALAVVLLLLVANGAHAEVVTISKEGVGVLRSALPAPAGTSCRDAPVLARIPSGTRLTVVDEARCQTGMIGQRWLKVEYQGKVGWLSEFMTTTAGRGCPARC